MALLGSYNECPMHRSLLKLALKVQRFQCKCISQSGIFVAWTFCIRGGDIHCSTLTMSSDSLHFNWGEFNNASARRALVDWYLSLFYRWIQNSTLPHEWKSLSYWCVHTLVWSMVARQAFSCICTVPCWLMKVKFSELSCLSGYYGISVSTQFQRNRTIRFRNILHTLYLFFIYMLLSALSTSSPDVSVMVTSISLSVQRNTIHAAFIKSPYTHQRRSSFSVESFWNYYLFTKTLIYCFMEFLFWLYLLIVLSGDIEINPGRLPEF